MASLEAGLYSYLTAQAAITAIVGTKIYPNRIPQGTALPCLMYSRTNTDHETQLAGAAGIATATMQIDCFATGAGGYMTVKNLANAVRVKLHGYRGYMGTEAVNDCSLQNEIDIYDEPAHAEDHGTHRVSMDFQIVYQTNVV